MPLSLFFHCALYPPYTRAQSDEGDKLSVHSRTLFIYIFFSSLSLRNEERHTDCTQQTCGIAEKINHFCFIVSDSLQSLSYLGESFSKTNEQKENAIASNLKPD